MVLSVTNLASVVTVTEVEDEEDEVVIEPKDDSHVMSQGGRGASHGQGHGQGHGEVQSEHGCATVVATRTQRLKNTLILVKKNLIGMHLTSHLRPLLVSRN